ncbi:hypothetical protein [Anaerohalosphaera lusitana]|nr:hypothetical protein [Anaerohalosphaera lusitana]
MTAFCVWVRWDAMDAVALQVVEECFVRACVLVVISGSAFGG